MITGDKDSIFLRTLLKKGNSSQKTPTDIFLNVHNIVLSN